MRFLLGGSSNRSVFKFSVFVLLFTLGINCLSSRALAQVRSDRAIDIALPPDPKDVAGFTCDFKWTAPTNVGYFPIEITIQPVANAFATDREVMFRLTPQPQGCMPPAQGLSIDVPISIAQGSGVQTVTRQLPKWTIGNGFQLRVFDDGVELNRYAVMIGQLSNSGVNLPPHVIDDEVSLDFWVVKHANDKPSFDQATSSIRRAAQQTVQMMANYRPIGFSRRLTSSPLGTQAVSYREIGLGSLPDDWRGFGGTDSLVMSSEALKELSEDKRRVEVVRQWVLSGGTVVTIDSDSIQRDAKHLGIRYVETQVKEPSNAMNVLQNNSLFALQEQGIKLREQLKFSERYESMSELEVAKAQASDTDFRFKSDYYVESATLKQQIKDHAEKLRRVKAQPRASLQAAGAGRLIAIDKGNGNSDAMMQLVFQSGNRSPMLRRGVEPLIGDVRAMRWMIPGVAQPPVYTFMGLLTVFVILVGPVAYFKTTRMGRSYLMFAIAPVLALLTTAALLAYGVVSDGFGTQARIRQLTWVDGASGDAIERVRATYFAGLSPSSGLRFPGDAEVMSYPWSERANWETLAERGFAIRGSATVSDGEQRFDNRLIPSRSQQQFVFHHPREKLGGIKLVLAGASTSAKVESSFDFQLTSVVVRDADGKYWLADKIDANTFATCSRKNPADASKKLGAMYTDYRPISQVRETSARRNRGVKDLITTVNRQLGRAQSMSVDGNVESWLQSQLLVVGELPRGTFCALSDVSDDVVSIEGAQQVASVRYVFGTLQ